ncbi:MAG: 23S rRNA (uracil(1939)-C(5))-methyltransferase RlmD [Clostridia bacterium]|nr:23S rRNA (uracil(1939)-C(5))-methyltransferase RlmD [Clostridia bacterium]
MKKNDIIRLKIESCTLEGSGVGYFDGTAIFVPHTAVGEEIDARIVKLQKNYAFGIVESIISPAECRIDPDCAVAGKCGGCAFRHINYAAELEIKQNAVAQVLRRIGGLENPPLQPIVGGVKQQGFRNKVQYPAVAGEDGKIRFGFYAKRSHRVISVEGCLLQEPIFGKALDIVADWANKNHLSAYDETTRKGLLRHIFLRYAAKKDQLMVMPVVNGAVPPCAAELADMLKAELGDSFVSLMFNINKKDTNVILGDKCIKLWGADHIVDTVCGVDLRISPLAFSQTNRDMAELLYKKVAELLPESCNNLIDLYCGGGAIGLTVAHRCKNLIGVEIVPAAVEDAWANAKANGIENARFICADASNAARLLEKEGITADAVILDPPRKGCDEALLDIVAHKFCPESIVYVSCNPATLARDTKYLKEQGYKMQSATPFDLFPRTAHCETVALFAKGE